MTHDDLATLIQGYGYFRLAGAHGCPCGDLRFGSIHIHTHCWRVGCCKYSGVHVWDDEYYPDYPPEVAAGLQRIAEMVWPIGDADPWGTYGQEGGREIHLAPRTDEDWVAEKRAMLLSRDHLGVPAVVGYEAGLAEGEAARGALEWLLTALRMGPVDMQLPIDRWRGNAPHGGKGLHWRSRAVYDALCGADRTLAALTEAR